MYSRDGLLPARFAMSEPMPHLEDLSRPRLAAGCRWAGEGESRTLVFPEGVLRLQPTAQAILERCDGERTFEQILAELAAAVDDLITKGSL